jgi:putative heme-binding domain-containing protein
MPLGTEPYSMDGTLGIGSQLTSLVSPRWGDVERFDLTRGSAALHPWLACLAPLGRNSFVACLLLLPLPILADESNAAQAAKDRTVVETLLRLKGMDVNSSPNWKAAAIRHLETVKGTPKYVELVEKLKLRGVEDELFRVAVTDPVSTHGAKAAELLVRAGELARFQKAISGSDEQLAANAVIALGNVATDPVVDVLKPIVVQSDRGAVVRVAAARGLGKNLHGQKYLLELAANGKLPAEVKFTAADVLLASADPSIRSAAAKHLTLPAGANSKPLPPIADLMKMKGDVVRGKQLFETTATCAKCHKVRGEGKEVGPDLSEIGSKLTTEAFFVSILDPNAGISHNYESYNVVTTGGMVLTGILVSRTDQSVTLRSAEAVDKEIPTSDIDELQKSPISLMPADLQKLMSAQDLVDVVEYVTTLKKPL